MKKSEVERILDKIEGEYITTTKEISNRENDSDKIYFAGKQKALRDLKTWIKENIVDGKTEV